jgi:hypothetical protein
MSFALPHLGGIAGVVVAAGAVQSAVGFGFALVATPLLLWTGMPLPDIVATVAVCSFMQSAMGAIHLRADVPWRLSFTATAVRVVFAAAGLLLLRRLAGLGADPVRFVVGCVLCVVVAVQWACRVQPARAVRGIWAVVAFVTSGLLAGMCGMGGPPLVLWSVAHDWSADKTRGFLFAVFALSIPIQIILMYLAFGPGVLRSSAIALLLTPAVVLGAAVGMPIGNRMPKPLLRNAVNALLLAIGLSAVLQALLKR